MTPAIAQTALGPIEYARSGRGPAILLVHGAMGGYDQSLLLGAATVNSPEFESIAVSRPGYLGTPLAAGRHPEGQADLCAALLDSLGIPSAAVIAISGGGQCALQFALRHPGRCRCLVMISACSATIRGRPPLRFHLMRLMARIPGMARGMREKALADPERAAARAIPDPEVRQRTLCHPEAGPLMLALQASTLDRVAERMAGTRNDIAQSRARFSYPLERITSPLLVVHGTSDRAAPFEAARALASRVSGAELLAIENGEHVSLFTHLDVIRTRVREFLGTHLPDEPKPPVPRCEPAVKPSTHSTAS